MVSRQCADGGSCHHDPMPVGHQGGSLVQRIDKADLLCYKHNTLEG
jgi:hypothetical protein